jgi:spore cortex formation protein SpoVR/YcgB (stage V sporulation)
VTSTSSASSTGGKNLWRTLHQKSAQSSIPDNRPFPAEPEENNLYFVEKPLAEMARGCASWWRIVASLRSNFYEIQTMV